MGDSGFVDPRTPGVGTPSASTGGLEQELLNPLKDMVFEIVSRIGKEEGYTMIWEMRQTGLAYAPAKFLKKL